MIQGVIVVAEFFRMFARQKRPVWDSRIAYVVGLMATDGNLSPDGRHLEFTSKDLEQVELLKQLLNLNNRITQKTSGFSPDKTYWRIQFGNVALYRWLMEIGLHPNKSKSLGALAVPDAYFWDFVRGCLDGDGTLKVYNDPHYPRSQRLYVYLYAASRSYLEWIEHTTVRIGGIHGYIDDGHGAWRLNYAKAASLALLRLLYYQPDLCCLKRKRDLVQKFL